MQSTPDFQVQYTEKSSTVHQTFKYSTPDSQVQYTRFLTTASHKHGRALEPVFAIFEKLGTPTSIFRYTYSTLRRFFRNTHMKIKQKLGTPTRLSDIFFGTPT